MADREAQAVLRVAVGLGKFPHEVSENMTIDQIVIAATFLHELDKRNGPFA